MKHKRNFRHLDACIKLNTGNGSLVDVIFIDNSRVVLHGGGKAGLVVARGEGEGDRKGEGEGEVPAPR